MPTSPYAASKYMGELVMLTNDNLYKLPTLKPEIAERSEGDFWYFLVIFTLIYQVYQPWGISSDLFLISSGPLSATKELALLYGLRPSQPRAGRLCHHHGEVHPSAEERWAADHRRRWIKLPGLCSRGGCGQSAHSGLPRWEGRNYISLLFLKDWLYWLVDIWRLAVPTKTGQPMVLDNRCPRLHRI